MSGPTLPPHGLLGVFPRDRPDAVVEQLGRCGVTRDEVRLDDPRDERLSLMAEQHQEVDDTFLSPQGGVIFPKEATKATAVVAPVITLVGAVLGLPLAFFFPDSMPLWARLLTAAVCGGLGGAAIALIAIPAMAVRNPQEVSAADRGVTLGVDRWSPEIEHAMAAGRPIRLDRLDEHGNTMGAVTTEEDRAPGGVVEELGRNFARERDADPERRTR